MPHTIPEWQQIMEKQSHTLKLQGIWKADRNGYDCDYEKQGFYIVRSESGLHGLVDAAGNMVLPFGTITSEDLDTIMSITGKK